MYIYIHTYVCGLFSGDISSFREQLRNSPARHSPRYVMCSSVCMYACILLCRSCRKTHGPVYACVYHVYIYICMKQQRHGITNIATKHAFALIHTYIHIYIYIHTYIHTRRRYKEICKMN